MTDVYGDFTRGTPILIKKGDHVKISNPNTGEIIFEEIAEKNYVLGERIRELNESKMGKRF